MKVITLTQPWATLLVTGEKVLETRSWRTNHSNLLLIHAAQGFPKEAQQICSKEPFRNRLIFHGYNMAGELPTAAIIGCVQIYKCVPTESVEISDTERAFGDYSPGRWAWECSRPQMFYKPVACKGKLSLWSAEKNLNSEQKEQLNHQLKMMGIHERCL